MPFKLTAKQEGFALCLAEGMSQTEAYRNAYSASHMAAMTVWKRASELARKGEVRGRLRELREANAKACEITVDGLTRQLEQDRELARAEKNASAAVSATMGIARLHGLLVEERKNNRDPFEGWSAREIQEAIVQVKAAVAMAKAKEPE